MSKPYGQGGKERPTVDASDKSVELPVIPQPINFFTNTHIDEEGRLTSPPNQVPAGGYVELKARTDLICVVSSCPFDLEREGWSINAPGGPTELIVELR